MLVLLNDTERQIIRRTLPKIGVLIGFGLYRPSASVLHGPVTESHYVAPPIESNWNIR